MNLTQEEIKILGKFLNGKEVATVLDGYNGQNVSSSFINLMGKEIRKYREDELYDERQTGVMINRSLEENRPKYEQQIDEGVKSYAELVDKLVTQSALISEVLEENALNKMKEKQYIYDHTLNMMRTKVSLALNVDEVSKVIDEYTEKATGNESLAKAIYSNAYLFADKVNQLATSSENRNKAMNKLRVSLSKIDNLAISNDERTVSKFKKGLLEKQIQRTDMGIGAKRLIKQVYDQIKSDQQEPMRYEKAYQNLYLSQIKGNGTTVTAHRQVIG